MNSLKIILFTIIGIAILIALYECYLTRETIIFAIKTKGSKAIPTISSILVEIEEYSKSIPNYKDYTFIDIGCGEGSTLQHMYSTVLFKKYIGIELETNIYNKAREKLNKNIELHNIDASIFKYKNVPTIVYIYEPLFSLSSDESSHIYNKWLSKLKKIDNIYIIYCSGSSNGESFLNSHAIENNNFKITKKKKIGGFIIYRTLCFIEKK